MDVSSYMYECDNDDEPHWKVSIFNHQRVALYFHIIHFICNFYIVSQNVSNSQSLEKYSIYNNIFTMTMTMSIKDRLFNSNQLNL